MFDLPNEEIRRRQREVLLMKTPAGRRFMGWKRTIEADTEFVLRESRWWQMVLQAREQGLDLRGGIMRLDPSPRSRRSYSWSHKGEFGEEGRQNTQELSIEGWMRARGEHPDDFDD